MDRLYDSQTGCCPRFDPGPWDEKEVRFEDKLFVRSRVRSFFHTPLNFAKVMADNMERISKAGALPPVPLVLCDESPLWGAEVYIAVAKDVPNSRMTRISGTFLTKVFEGPYKNIRKWIKQMEEYVAIRNKDIEKMYFFYTTCPKCAEYYGKNYVVILAKVRGS